MMQYMILNYVKPNGFAGTGNPDTDVEGPAWGAYTKAMMDAGVMVGGNALHPTSTATTVRMIKGKRDVHDGPFAETKEHLGGYYIIDVPNLDAALEWAARNPAASTGCVEVRPVMQL
jgi:hypothetical protein